LDVRIGRRVSCHNSILTSEPKSSTIGFWFPESHPMPCGALSAPKELVRSR
jgi:hypothetical protein